MNLPYICKCSDSSNANVSNDLLHASNDLSNASNDLSNASNDLSNSSNDLSNASNGRLNASNDLCRPNMHEQFDLLIHVDMKTNKDENFSIIRHKTIHFLEQEYMSHKPHPS